MLKQWSRACERCCMLISPASFLPSLPPSLQPSLPPSLRDPSFPPAAWRALRGQAPRQRAAPSRQRAKRGEPRRRGGQRPGGPDGLWGSGGRLHTSSAVPGIPGAPRPASPPGAEARNAAYKSCGGSGRLPVPGGRRRFPAGLPSKELQAGPDRQGAGTAELRQR